MKYNKIKVFTIPLLVVITFSSCATRYKGSFIIPEKDGELAWNRAHSFIAQYHYYNPFLITPYVITSIASGKGNEFSTGIRIIREKSKEGYKYIIMYSGFLEKDEYMELIRGIHHYIQTGELPPPPAKNQEPDIRFIWDKKKPIGPIPAVEPMKQYKRTNTRSD
jgi:hypothetical protein